MFLKLVLSSSFARGHEVVSDAIVGLDEKANADTDQFDSDLVCWFRGMTFGDVSCVIIFV